MGTVGYFVYEQDMIARYNAYTEDTLNYVARAIDGDDLQQCMQTGEKSDKYNELQALMNDIKETHKLEFLYIIQPISENPPDNMMDVLAAYTQEGKEAGTDGLTDLGRYTMDLYPPEVARQYLARMDYDPKVTFFPNDTDFGNIYTAIRPIFNSQGEPIAVLCADVLTNELNAGRIRFIVITLFLALLAGALLSMGMSYWLMKRVAEPIKRISHSASDFAVRCHDSNDLEVMSFRDPNIHTHDEIEELSLALASMCDNMKEYARKLINADREVDTLKEQVVEIGQLAYTDPLTGAGSKAAYEKYISRLDWDISARRARFAIVMVDLNFLKRVNDTYGHDCGNQYIKNLYALMWHSFQWDMIYRIGGDEFIILVQGERTNYLNSMLQQFWNDMAYTANNPNLEPWQRISAAIGVAIFNPAKHRSVNDVFKEADANMYENKKSMKALRE